MLVVGVTGSGKGALLEHLRTTFPELTFAVSCVTRPPRPGEVDGHTYHFVSEAEFEERRARGEFLEWTEKYVGIKYGTLKSEIIVPMQEGKTVIREVDIDGVKSLFTLIPREHLTVIAIDAGGWETVEERITKRAALSAPELQSRKERYRQEDPYFKEVADFVISNPDGNLEAAKRDIEEVVRGLMSR